MYALVGILIGVLIRTFLPYFQKLQDDPSLKFDWRYIVTALFSTVITAFILMPLFTIPNASVAMIVMQAAVFAFTAQEFLNAYAKARGASTPVNSEQPVETTITVPTETK